MWKPSLNTGYSKPGWALEMPWLWTQIPLSQPACPDHQQRACFLFLPPSEPHTKVCAHQSEACTWLILPCDIVPIVTQQSHFTMSKDDKHICDSSHIVLPSPCSGLPAALPVPWLASTTTLLCSFFSHGHIPSPSTDSAPQRLRLQLMWFLHRFAGWRILWYVYRGENHMVSFHFDDFTIAKL